MTLRLMPLLVLGFAAGVPYMLTSRTMKLWARAEGVDLTTIGLFSLVALPYSLKVFWAPVMDRVNLPLLGRRRGWLLLTQVLVMFAIAGMGITGPTSVNSQLTVFAMFAVLVAVCSASQDIVADAYRTDVLQPAEYGAGASSFITGYRIALLASGAGAVYLSAFAPWNAVYFVCAAMMFPGIVNTILARNPPADNPPARFVDAVLHPVRDLLHRQGLMLAIVLLFIIAFKLPDYMAMAMIDAMLIDLGFSERAIAFWGLGVGTAASIPGVMLGGLIATRLGLGRALLIFGIAQAASNAGYYALALAGPNQLVMILVVGVEYFCSGLVAAGFVAFLMSQCHRRYSATQYALLSSLMGLSAAIGGAPTGWIVSELSYPAFFAITIAAAIPGMLLLIPLLPTLRRSALNASAASQAC